MTQELAAELAAGIRALERGEAAEALRHLEAVVASEALAAAEDLQDIRARALSLHAQAALAVGELATADGSVIEALRLLRGLGDERGRQQVRALQGEIVGAIARERADAAQRAQERVVAATPVGVLLRGLTDPAARAEAFVKKSQAELAAGDAPHARELADLGLRAALSTDDVRHEVVARLALARAAASAGDAETATREVRAAWRRAERASEPQLTGMAGRTARHLSVSLPVLRGPTGPADP